MSDLVEIEIDGKPYQAKPNSMVIQVADEAGVYIPRFCYHKHLSVAANCRMCLVEVEKSPKALPACATPIMPGMKVFTKSPKALAAQKAVMEFLLINHPLDCPICDQGGECELQDLSLGFGSADSFYNEGKRTVKDKDIGPLVETEMTRCIQCTRCVRFGTEVAGLRELGATGRGEHMEIGTYIEHAMTSEVSGNIIDLCPVGALTSKPFRFTARAWELEQNASIAPHDCVGSNIYIHTRYGKVMRAVPHENPNINETWISDRDRFSYEGLYHSDRLDRPYIRVNGEWQETDWEMALEFAVEGLQRVAVADGAGQIGALASPNSTLEEFYLLQKLMRGIDSPNIDHRLRQVDFADQDTLAAFPSLGMSIADIENCDTIFLIGANIQKEQPLASIRVRKAALKGAKVVVLNMADYPFHFNVAGKQIVAPLAMASALAKIEQAVTDATSQDVIAQALRGGKQTAILLGNLAANHPHASTLRGLAQRIAQKIGATVGMMTEGANSAGAWLAGAVPHRGPAAAKVKPGLDAQAMLHQARKAYLLMNVEPDLDCANSMVAIKALENAEFVVSLSQFKNPILEKHADVILPIAPFTETSGTFVNAAGNFQTFKGVANPVGESRPAWKVLRVLGNLFQLNEFEYQSAQDVRDEIDALIDKLEFTANASSPVSEKHTKEVATGLTRLGEIPIYAVDSLVRRAKALQAAQPSLEGQITTIRMNQVLAERLGLYEGMMALAKQPHGEVILPVSIDARLPDQTVLIAGGIPETASLGELIGAVEVSAWKA